MQYLNTRRHLLELMSKSGGGVVPITLREGPQHELLVRFYSIKQGLVCGHCVYPSFIFLFYSDAMLRCNGNDVLSIY